MDNKVKSQFLNIKLQIIKSTKSKILNNFKVKFFKFIIININNFFIIIII
jgi:hypothetical protein